MSEVVKVNEQLFNSFLSNDQLRLTDVKVAKSNFDEYLAKGIFLDCQFEDLIWRSTDQYSNVGLRFNFNEFSYRRYYESLFQMDFQKFVNFTKVFISFTLGKNILKTLQTFLNDLKRIIRTNPEELYGADSTLKVALPSLCIDFFTVLPLEKESEEFERFVSILEEYISISYNFKGKKQRNLAQFDTYFLFHDILNDYWSKNLSKDERLFYYPLYLWWQITGVIPLRPKEFILTTRDCLKGKRGEYLLTLRRNNLKGGNKKVSYTIAEDYFETTYQISDDLADEINNYLEFTKEYGNTELDTLFITDTHYQKWNQKKHTNSRFLTYVNLSTILRYFYFQVISNQYGLTIIYDSTKKRLAENEIGFIRLGDTRHIALINIIAEGATPVTAMLLAGHDNVSMSEHYYSNITNLIECSTYRQYRAIEQGEVRYQVSNYKARLTQGDSYEELDNGGSCYSNMYKNGDFSDCLKTAGKDGEIGDCFSCKFYRKKGKSYFSGDGQFTRQIFEECKALEHAVNMVRADKGATEDIGQVMLNLKSSCYSYQQYHQEKIAQMHEEGEKIWPDQN